MSGYRRYRDRGRYYRDWESDPYGGGGGGGGGWGRNYDQGGRYEQNRSGGRRWRDGMMNTWEDRMVPGVSGYNPRYDSSFAGSYNHQGDRYDNQRGSVYGRLGTFHSWGDSRDNRALYRDKLKFPTKSKNKGRGGKRGMYQTVKVFSSDDDEVEMGSAMGEAETESQGVTKEDKDSKPSEAKETKDDTEEAEKKTEDNPKQEGDGEEQEHLSEGDENEEKVPPEALICHICDKTSFTSLDDFHIHIYGKNHNKLARVYLEKVYSMLALLKAQSRLQSQQHILKNRRERGKISMCEQCECPVYIKSGMNVHIRCRPHALIGSFTKCGWCKARCKSRGALEKHFLTTEHIARTHEVWLRDKDRAMRIRNQEYDFPEMEAMNKLHDEVYALRVSYLKTLAWNLRQVDAYDPSRIFGINHIERVPQFYCTVCSKKVLHSAKGALHHFTTQDHYQNYVAHLMALEDKKQKDKKDESTDNKEAQDGDGDDVMAEISSRKNSCEDAPKGQDTDTVTTNAVPDDDSIPQAADGDKVPQENNITPAEKKSSPESMETEKGEREGEREINADEDMEVPEKVMNTEEDMEVTKNAQNEVEEIDESHDKEETA